MRLPWTVAYQPLSLSMNEAKEWDRISLSSVLFIFQSLSHASAPQSPILCRDCLLDSSASTWHEQRLHLTGNGPNLNWSSDLHFLALYGCMVQTGPQEEKCFCEASYSFRVLGTPVREWHSKLNTKAIPSVFLIMSRNALIHEKLWPCLWSSIENMLMLFWLIPSLFPGCWLFYPLIPKMSCCFYREDSRESCEGHVDFVCNLVETEEYISLEIALLRF